MGLFAVNHPVEAAIDFGTVAALIGVLMGLLPHITAVLTFVWAVGRLWEMFTGCPVHETKPVKAVLKLLKGSRCSG